MNLQTITSGVGLTPKEAESRRDKLASHIKWGALAVGVLVIAPLAFLLLKATIALILTGVLAAFVAAGAPVLSMRLSNWKLRAILDEARRNPIPTLEHELIQRKTALQAAGGQLRTSLGQVESFVTQAEDAARQYPDMANRWRERANKARQLAEAKKNSYVSAQNAVRAFESEVERCRTEWKLVMAEAAMNKSLDIISGDPLAQLKARTALDSVTDRMNEAFASMEVALLESPSPAHKGGTATSSSQPILIDAQEVEDTPALGLFKNINRQQAEIRRNGDFK